MSDYKPKSNDSKWWWEDYDYSHRDHSFSKGSGSRSWMSKIGFFDDYWKPKKNKDAVYKDLLSQLQNSANVIGDEEKGKINVRWSNGQDINDYSDNSVYLSPDNLLTTSGGVSEVSEDVLDGMTGKVYLASSLRDTVHPDCLKKSVESRHSKLSEEKQAGLTIWEAMETSIARKKILEDWVGFGPYIASESKMSSDNKQQVQDYINQSEANPNCNALATAIGWNLLNADDQVKIPSVYDKCIEAAAEILEEEIDAADRFDSCNEIANVIYQILKKEECENQCENNEEGESGSGDGEGEDSDGDSESNSESNSEDKSDCDNKSSGEPVKKPTLCDSSMLGGKVENQTNAELSEQNPDSKADDSSVLDSNIDHLCDRGKEYIVKKSRPSKTDVVSYKEIVAKNKAVIKAVTDSLLFKSNNVSLQSYGHRSGDIDENNLYKVAMNDDRVMMKTDVVDGKKIAICILIDESGSMCCGDHSDSAGRYVTRYELARDAAIVLAESLRKVDGIELSIYGHTAETGNTSGVELREYVSPRNSDLTSLMKIDARSHNHDSWAILHTANLFKNDYHDYDRKIMFVISDGEPAGSFYGGKPAVEHMKKVSEHCGKLNVEVYGIGVDNAFTKSMGDAMYGEGKCVILKDVSSSIGVIKRFIRQVATK